MKSAIKYANDIGMNLKPEDIITCELRKGAIPWDKTCSAQNPDDELDESDDDEDSEQIVTMDCSYFRDYSGQVGEIDGNSPFVKVFDKDGSQKLIRKSSVAWIASESKEKLSNDRQARSQPDQLGLAEPEKFKKKNHAFETNNK